MGGRRLAVFGEPLTVAVRDPRDAEGPRWATLTLRTRRSRPSIRPAPDRRRATAVPLRHRGRVRCRGSARRSRVPRRSCPPAEALAPLAKDGGGFVLTREGVTRVIAATPGFAAAHALAAEEGVVLRP